VLEIVNLGVVTWMDIVPVALILVIIAMETSHQTVITITLQFYKSSHVTLLISLVENHANLKRVSLS
jgi:hypothetical protein